ncbi:hypothetical protein D4R42_00865 [bacterium]|nr:MAG: hypothetical protein D4R42_00865 [bacterium]
MICTAIEYSRIFKFRGKKVSARTVKRRCENGMLPGNHKARKLPGRRGMWLIEVIDQRINANPNKIFCRESVIIEEDQ